MMEMKDNFTAGRAEEIAGWGCWEEESWGGEQVDFTSWLFQLWNLWNLISEWGSMHDLIGMRQCLVAGDWKIRRGPKGEWSQKKEQPGGIYSYVQWTIVVHSSPGKQPAATFSSFQFTVEDFHPNFSEMLEQHKEKAECGGRCQKEIFAHRQCEHLLTLSLLLNFYVILSTCV